MATHQPMGNARMPSASHVSRRRGPIHHTVTTRLATTTTSQIAAAASNGSSASGRNRIASSGGYGYPSGVLTLWSGGYSGSPAFSRPPAQ